MALCLTCTCVLILPLSLWLGITISQLVYGIRTNCQAKSYEHFLPQQDTIYIYYMAIAISVMSLLPLISCIFISCKKAAAGVIVLLCLIIVFIFPTVVLEFASGILALMMRDTLLKEAKYLTLNRTMLETLQSNNPADVQAWDTMQSALKCCGVEQKSDWPIIPSSCCEGSPISCPVTEAYDLPCEPEVRRLIQEELIPLLMTTGLLYLIPAILSVLLGCGFNMLPVLLGFIIATFRFRKNIVGRGADLERGISLFKALRDHMHLHPPIHPQVRSQAACQFGPSPPSCSFASETPQTHAEHPSLQLLLRALRESQIGNLVDGPIKEFLQSRGDVPQTLSSQGIHPSPHRIRSTEENSVPHQVHNELSQRQCIIQVEPPPSEEFATPTMNESVELPPNFHEVQGDTTVQILPDEEQQVTDSPVGGNHVDEAQHSEVPKTLLAVPRTT